MVGLVLVLALAYVAQIPQKTLAKIVSQEMSKIFKQPVRIGSVKGNFVTGVSLRDMQFFNPADMTPGAMLEISRADVKYNLMEAFRHKGDILAATHLVTLSGVRLKILRDKQDKWNVFSLVPPPDPNAPPAPLTFKGIIRMQDMGIAFVDEKGWGAEVLDVPFSDVFSPMTGMADFADISRAQLRLQGTLASNGAPVNLVGSLDVNTGQFRMVMGMKSFNFKRWQPYVLPFSEIALDGDTVDIDIYLRSKYFPEKGSLPFFFDIKTVLKETALKLPVFSESIRDISGTFRMTNSLVLPTDMAAALGVSLPVAKEIMAYLKSERILDPKDRVDATVVTTMPPLKPLVLPPKWQGHMARLRMLLNSPDVRFVGDTVSGTLAGASFSGKGYLIINDGRLNLDLVTAPFSAKSLVRLFPALAAWQLTGHAQGTVSVTGRIANPTVAGRMQSPLMRVRGVAVTTPVMTYAYHGGQLETTLLSGRVYGTDLTGAATTRFTPTGPTYTGSFDLRWLPVGPGGFGVSFVTGNAHVKGVFSGVATQMDVDYQVPTATLVAWQQRVNAAQGRLRVTFSPLSYEVLSGDVVLNDGAAPVGMTALLRPARTWSVTASGNVRIYDPLAQKITGPLLIKGGLSANWPSAHTEIWDTVSGNIVMTGQDISFLGKKYTTVSGAADFRQRETRVHDLTLRNGGERASFSGSLYRMVVTSGVLELLNYHVDADFLRVPGVPQRLKPMTSAVTGQIAFSQSVVGGLPSWKTTEMMADLTFKDSRIQNQPIGLLHLRGKVSSGNIALSEIKGRHQSSVLNARALVRMDGTGAVEILSGTMIQLADFQPVLYEKIGPLVGAVSVTGTVSGLLKKPDATLNMSVLGLKSYAFGLKEISGQVMLRDGKLSIQEGRIKEALSAVGFSGHLRLWGPSDGPRYSWQISFQETPLDVLAVVVESLRKELGLREVAGASVSRLQERVKQPNVQVVVSAFSIQDPSMTASETRRVYQPDGDSSVQFYQDVNRRYQYAQSVPDLGLRRLLSGRLSGGIDIEAVSDKGVPKINASLAVSDASLGVLQTAMLQLNATSHEEGVLFDIQATKGNMGGTAFDYLRLGGQLTKDGLLSVTKADVMSQGRENKNVVSGTLPLAAFWDDEKANDPIDMELRWDGDDINVLTVFTPYVSKLSNKGRVVLRLTGTVAKPLLSAKELVLKDAVVFLNPEMTPFLSGLRIDNQTVISLKDNVLTVSPLILNWEGEDTRPLHSNTPRKNTFAMSGTMTVKNLSLVSLNKVDLDFDLNFATTDIAVNLSKVYQGNIRLEKIAFQGVYEFPFSSTEKTAHVSRQGTERERGPLLSGDAYLSRGVLSLPTLGEKKIKPSILFNVSAFIRENMSIDGSLVGEGLLGSVTNKFHLELAESIQPLLLGGSFNALKIRNSVALKAGYVLMLNRSFDVLSLEGQRIYYRDAQYRVHDNSVAFQTEFSSGKARLIPHFNVTALTVVEPKIVGGVSVSSDVQVNPDDTKYSHVLVTLSGSAYDLQNFLFEKYVSAKQDVGDGVDYRNSYRLAGGANQADTVAILRLLAPQVFDVAESGDSRANDTFWKDIGSSQINLIFNSALRPIETDLARNVGLNDIRFDYNVGQALFNNFSDKSVGINFVKSWFSNQLFVRVKTSVDLERKSQADALELSEVELTYFFEKYFSVNVTNFRKDIGTYRNKYSVKYSNDF